MAQTPPANEKGRAEAHETHSVLSKPFEASWIGLLNRKGHRFNGCHPYPEEDLSLSNSLDFGPDREQVWEPTTRKIIRIVGIVQACVIFCLYWSRRE
jgi:hypothetical protein